MKTNMFFDKVKIKCRTHPTENIITICMNPYCKADKLICNICLSEQIHECRNKMPLHKLYDFSDEKTYTQIQVEKRKAERIDYHLNQEKEVQQAYERMEYLLALKEKFIAKFDQVIESQQNLIDGFVKRYRDEHGQKQQEESNQVQQKQGEESKEEATDEQQVEQQENQENNQEIQDNDAYRGRTISQLNQHSDSRDTQKALQRSMIRYLEQLQNQQERDINQVSEDICKLQLQHHNQIRYLKQNQAGHIVVKSQDDLFQMEYNALKSIGELNELVKIVHKYDQVQLEGYDSYSQTSIENLRNLYKNSKSTIRSQIVTECDILSVDISQDRRFLIIGCGKPKYVVLVFDIQDQNLQKPKLIASLPHTSSVQIVRIAPNGLFFCSGCESSAVRMYSTQQLVYKNKNNLLKTFMDHSLAITGIQYSRDNKLLVTSSQDRSVIIYDVSAPANSHIIHKLKLDSPVIAFDLTVRYMLAVITQDNMCTIYQNARTNPEVLHKIPFSGSIRDIKISLNERYLCVNDYFTNCYIYDLTYQPPLLYDTILLTHTNNMAFHSDNSNILAISKGDTNYNIYELSDNDHPTPSKLIYTSAEHNDTVLTLKFYNNFIISGGKDKRLLITEVF